MVIASTSAHQNVRVIAVKGLIRTLSNDKNIEPSELVVPMNYIYSPLDTNLFSGIHPLGSPRTHPRYQSPSLRGPLLEPIGNLTDPRHILDILHSSHKTIVFRRHSPPTYPYSPFLPCCTFLRRQSQSHTRDI